MSLFAWIQLFETLTDDESNTLWLFCQERFLHMGEVLFHEWDDAVAFYIVKEGTLKAYKERSDGEKILGYIEAGEIAGEMALFDPAAPKKRMASIQAVSDVLLLVIMDYAILELSKKHVEIYNKIAEIIIKRKERQL